MVGSVIGVIGRCPTLAVAAEKGQRVSAGAMVGPQSPRVVVARALPPIARDRST